MSKIVIAGGATISALEVKRVEEALATLAKDHHAPREITLTATLSVHHEFPKVLYKGKGTKTTVSVADDAAETAARADGYGDYEHDADQESVGV
jgi:hypothetical protein